MNYSLFIPSLQLDHKLFCNLITDCTMSSNHL